MIFTRIPRLFHSLLVPFGGGFHITPSFKQFRQVIIATDVARFTCKNFFKQLLCLGVIACFYILERQRMLNKAVFWVFLQKVFKFFNPIQR